MAGRKRSPSRNLAKNTIPKSTRSSSPNCFPGISGPTTPSCCKRPQKRPALKIASAPWSSASSSTRTTITTPHRSPTLTTASSYPMTRGSNKVSAYTWASACWAAPWKPATPRHSTTSREPRKAAPRCGHCTSFATSTQRTATTASTTTASPTGDWYEDTSARASLSSAPAHWVPAKSFCAVAISTEPCHKSRRCLVTGGAVMLTI